MIPQGTVVRGAHACHEVVVPVTVPDKPRLASRSWLLPLLSPVDNLDVIIYTDTGHAGSCAVPIRTTPSLNCN
jgi:hypothetical protein